MLPPKQTSFYYFTCLPRREHITLSDIPLFKCEKQVKIYIPLYLFFTEITFCRSLALTNTATNLL